MEMDRLLDAARTGPLWLRNPAVATLVQNSLIHLHSSSKLELFAWVVMANHVHAIVKPAGELHIVLKSLKGYTARQANKLLQRSGPFWQDESFDHWFAMVLSSSRSGGI